MALLAVGDTVEVLSNPDAPESAHEWRPGVVEEFSVDPEVGEQMLMVRYPGELQAVPVATQYARRVADDD